MKPVLHWLELDHLSIFEQLQLEEALVRTDTRNICIVNPGSARTIVMGISGDPKLLLNTESVLRDEIPVIKRFSGGGTVIVDENTLFVSFICNHDALQIAPYPEPLLRWTSELYQQSWQIPSFVLQEQDYAIGYRKCGGNAQYIRKGRWAHHTSFLWDYKDTNMDYLQLPAKRPKYRADRPHSEFLCRLKDVAPSKKILIDQLKNELVKQFYIQDFCLKNLTFPPHRQATQRISMKS